MEIPGPRRPLVMRHCILYLTTSLLAYVSVAQDTPYTFDPVVIHAIQKPDTVVGSSRFYITDFEFYGEQLVLLTFEKKPEKSRVMLTDKDQKVIRSSEITIPAEKLYRDYMGGIWALGKEKIWKIEIGKNDVSIREADPEKFRYNVRPCIDTIGISIAFSNFDETYPEFNYYLWNRADSTAQAFYHVIDVDLADLYSFEYTNLKPRDKLNARKLERATGIDKHRIAAMMTGFAQSHYFTPLYAPLFVAGDSMLLFEHYRNKLYHFNEHGVCTDSSPVNYHKPAKWKEWKREVLRDPVQDRYFGLFQKNGTWVLKEIDSRKGELRNEYPLYFPYASNIRVKNGEAWYLYRPFESLQNAFLYKEPLPR